MTSKKGTDKEKEKAAYGLLQKCLQQNQLLNNLQNVMQWRQKVHPQKSNSDFTELRRESIRTYMKCVYMLLPLGKAHQSCPQPNPCTAKCSTCTNKKKLLRWNLKTQVNTFSAVVEGIFKQKFYSYWLTILSWTSPGIL